MAALLAVGIALVGCFLIKHSTPEEIECSRQAAGHEPDVTGAWETSDGVRLDVRQSPTRRSQLEIVVAAETAKQPDWKPGGAWLQPPGVASAQPLVCGDTWRVQVTKTFPDRVAQPGQLVSQDDRLMARLVSADRIEFDGGEVWTRVGAVGALQIPKPGEVKDEYELQGTVYKTFDLKTGLDTVQRECIAACKADERCAAAVEHTTMHKCRLLSSLASASQAANLVSWINPDFDFDPPPVPIAGTTVRLLQLKGTELKVLAVSNRAADRECARACDEDWSCKGYSVETWDGSCHLMSTVTGAKRAGDTWYAHVQSERVAVLPVHGSYAQDTKLGGTVLRSLDTQSKGLMGCHDACTGDEACRGFNYLRIQDRNSTISSHNQCVLLADLGTPELAQHWVTYVEPYHPKPPTEPPSQEMTSPLCKGHPDAQPAYSMSNTDVRSKHMEYIDLPELPFTDPTRPSFTGSDQGRAWTTAFFLRPLPDGNVHIHAWYKADLVLKVADGEVVVGAADANSEWRIEHLWEHMDPPAWGVWYVVRNPDTGMFLAATKDGGVTLVGNPLDASAHWHFDDAVLPTETYKAPTPFPVVEPPPLPFDEAVVDALTRWAVKEHLRQQVPACYKHVDNFSCPATGQPFNCGALCTQDLGVCVETAADMTLNVGILVANVAGAVLTGGAANAAIKAGQVAGQGAKAGLRYTMKTAGRKMAKELRERLGARVIAFIASKGKSEAFKKLAKSLAVDLAKKAGKLTAKQAMNVDAAAYLQVEQDRFVDKIADAYADEVARRAAELIAARAAVADDPDLLAIAATLDPTGVFGVIDSFTKPMCDENPMPELEF